MADLQPNQQLNILLDTPEGEVILSCYIKEVYADRVSLTNPLDYQNYLSYLNEGDELKTKILTRLGVMLYKALILNPPTDDEFVIEYNEDIAKTVQRRVYTRIPLETVVDCEYLEGELEISESQQDKTTKASQPISKAKEKMVEFSTQISCEFETSIIEAETIDIGGGGLKIKSKEALPYNKLITFKINLFDDIISAKGLLVENNGFPERQYGVKFTQVKEEDKDRIIKTCFKIESILNRRND